MKLVSIDLLVLSDSLDQEFLIQDGNEIKNTVFNITDTALTNKIKQLCDKQGDVELSSNLKSSNGRQMNLFFIFILFRVFVKETMPWPPNANDPKCLDVDFTQKRDMNYLFFVLNLKTVVRKRM